MKFGISFNFTAFNQAGALVHVYKDGSVLINHGGTEMGQGLHTKMIQVAATTLGVPLERVRLAPTRTDKVPNTSATAASSGADLNGGAVKHACEQILERLEAVDAGRDLPWEDLVREAYFSRVQLWAAGFYRTEGLHWDSTAMHGHPFKYFAYGAAAAEVEVDGFTGGYRTRRVDIVHDVGDSLSPLVDLGQIEGGFVQGAGWLTLEDLRWDESDGPGRGRLTTQAASTYKLPSFSEMPDEINVALLARAHEDGAVYGSKAVGEPPLMLAFSVREALREAAACVRDAPGPPSTSPHRPRRRRSTGRSSRRAGRGSGQHGRDRRRTARRWYPTSPPPTPSRCTRGPSAWLPGRRRCPDALAGRGRAAAPRTTTRSAGHGHRRPRARAAGRRRQDGGVRRRRCGGASVAATSRRRRSCAPEPCSATTGRPPRSPVPSR